MGSVIWWQKGWAKSCHLGNSVIRTQLIVTKSLNCTLFLDHINRCSKPEAIIEDCISKFNYFEMRSIMPLSETFPRRAPAALINWVRDPKPDRDLGEKILNEMSNTTRLLSSDRKMKTHWDH